MQPIRLVIPGDYWDSQIYRGRLYLTDMNGGTHVYDWDHAVDLMIHNDSDKLTITCAFARGDYLYHPEWALVFNDPDVGTVLRDKFSYLAKAPLEMTSTILETSLIGAKNSPGGLADDTAVYANNLFSVTGSGLLRTNIRDRRSKRNRSGIGAPRKIWDGTALSLAVRSGGDLALAAGDGGLFELTHLFSDELERPRQVSERHTDFVGYAHASIYGSSDRFGGYLAAYTWNKGPDLQLQRQYAKTFGDVDIFKGSSGVSWANQEKIYLCKDNELLVSRYIQKEVSERNAEPFRSLGLLQVPLHGHRVIAGGVSFFGTIIEHDAGLIVVQSDNDVIQIPGPVTRWRAFPRSNRYENHLHVIFEDRLEIFSFNQDYMVEQDSKLAGIEYRPARTTYQNASVGHRGKMPGLPRDTG